jgi:hypothetical protein
LLKVIIACLTVKAVGLTLTLLSLKAHPILVLGDAIAEYLQRPDDTTLQSSLKQPESSTSMPTRRQGASVANTTRPATKAARQAFFPGEDWTELGWLLGIFGTLFAFMALSLTLKSGGPVKTLSSPKNPRCASSFPY